MKNRVREKYSFANINLLGPCNARCFFCLGKDIAQFVRGKNHVTTHFSQWRNFRKYLQICKDNGIKKLYITGQNTDSLLYHYLEEIIDALQAQDFTVGLRTNGYLALAKMKEINKCNNSVGYSIHSLNSDTNWQIMRRRDIPDWQTIIPQTRHVRVAVVVNRYNVREIDALWQFLAQFDNLRYIQMRKVSTDSRYAEHQEDMRVFDNFLQSVNNQYRQIGEFNLAPKYEIYGKEVVFWKTIETSINSMNYFTDGTISDNYFVVEGYLNNYKQL